MRYAAHLHVGDGEIVVLIARCIDFVVIQGNGGEDSRAKGTANNNHTNLSAHVAFSGMNGGDAQCGALCCQVTGMIALGVSTGVLSSRIF